MIRFSITPTSVGSSKNYFVFVIPIAEELDLKAAARSGSQLELAPQDLAKAAKAEFADIIRH